MSIQPVPPTTGPTTAGQLAARATQNDQILANALAELEDRASDLESRSGTSGYLVRNVNGAVADADGRVDIGLPDLAQIDAMQQVLDNFIDGIDPSDLTTAHNVETPGTQTRTALDGHYTQITTRPENILRFGADPTGATDSTAAIQAAIDSAGPHGTVEWGAGRGDTYLVSSQGLWTGLGANWSGEQRGLMLRDGQTHIGNGATVRMAAGQPQITPILDLMKVSDVTVRDLRLDGTGDEQSGSGPQDGGLHGVRIYGGARIKLQDLHIRNCYSDGVYVRADRVNPYTPPEDVTMTDVTCDGNKRQGMTIVQVRRLNATRCRFINTHGISPQAGVDIEPNNPGEIVENITFTDCDFTGNTGWGIVVHVADQLRNLRVTGGTFSGNGLHDLRISGSQANNVARNVRIVDNDFLSPGGVELGTTNGLVMRDLRLVRNTFAWDLLIRYAQDLLVDSNVFLLGAGEDRVVLQQHINRAKVVRNIIEGGRNGIRVAVTDTGQTVFDVDVAENTVRGMSLRGIFEFAGSTRVRIRDNNVADCLSVGIRSGATVGQIRGNEVRNCDMGVSLWSQSSGQLVADNQAINVTTPYDINGTGHTQRDNLTL